MNFIANLKVGHRFALTGVIALVLCAIPTTLFVREAYQVTQTAQREAQGVAPAKAILKVIQLTQQHRGLSALVLGGNTATAAQRAAKQQEADTAYQGLSTIAASEVRGVAARAAWDRAVQDWSALRGKVAGGGISVSESFAGHTALVAQLLKTNDLFADDFGLSLDPMLDSYQLIQAVMYALPALAEELGKTRAKGAGMLATKTGTPADRQALSLYVGMGAERLSQMTAAFDKAAAVNPELKGKLAGSMREATDLAQQAIKLANEQILKQEQLSYSGPEYVSLLTKAIDAQFNLNEAAMGSLGTMLSDRAASERRRLVTVLALMIGLAVLCSWFGVAVARSITRQLGGEPAYAADVVKRVADGNLTKEIATRDGDSTSLLAWMKKMQENLRGIVGEIKESTETIGTASSQIAQGNADLSQRTEEQASSLEETASSMEELTSTVKQNAENAKQANQLAAGASDVAVKGGAVVKQVVDTMSAISESSKKIADIIGVIDGIAFQTNILALNAAVEAARAGEQGRGFAVVASEVRNLAQRSAAAAKEIKALIGDSVEKVGTGTKLVDEAGQTMQEIVSSVKRVTDIMAEITAASQEQSSGIEQVNTAITQMDEVTQQNAALVEEAAAAAESMQEQAEQLAQAVSVFKLDHEAAGAIARVPAPKRESTAQTHRASVTPLKRKLAPVKLAAANADAPRAKKVAGGGDEEWKEF